MRSHTPYHHTNRYGINIDAEGFAEERRLSSLLSRMDIASHTHMCSFATPNGNSEGLLQCLDGSWEEVAGVLGGSCSPQLRVEESPSLIPKCLAIDPRPRRLLHVIPCNDRRGLIPQPWRGGNEIVIAQKENVSKARSDSGLNFVMDYRSIAAQEESEEAQDKLDAQAFLVGLRRRAIVYQQQYVAGGAPMHSDSSDQREERLRAMRRLVTETSYLDTFVDDIKETTAKTYVDRVHKAVQGHTFAHHRMRNQVARRILSNDALWKRTAVPGIGWWLPPEEKATLKESGEVTSLASEWICRGSYMLVLLMHIDEVLRRSRKSPVNAKVNETKEKSVVEDEPTKTKSTGDEKGAKDASGVGDGSGSAA